MKHMNMKIICAVLLGIILKAISFYKYRETLFLNNILSISIYFFMIFGDIFLSRIKSFVKRNVFILLSISSSIFIIISKFDIEISYITQCLSLVICIGTILYNKEDQEEKTEWFYKIFIILRSVIMMVIVMAITVLIYFKTTEVSLDDSKMMEIYLNYRMKEFEKI